MAIDLIKLGTQLTDKEFAKIILSSGDLFPGFYRFTLGTRNHEDGQLSINGLVRVFLSQISIGELYDREEWTRYTKIKHDSLDDRNKSRSDYAIYELLDTRYLSWMTTAKTYDIALIEIDNSVEEINTDTTYFFMGSMIRFTESEMLIGYDALRQTSVMSVPIEFGECVEYINSIYTKSQIKDLFLTSDIVASLSFDTEDMGSLHMTDSSLERCMTCHPNSVVISSNRDVSAKLPMRWAKDILLSEVDML